MKVMPLFAAKNFLLLCLLSLCSFQMDAQRELLYKKQSTTCLDRDFSVMVHITRDSFDVIDANITDIRDAIELVNLWFEPICVRFHIAQIDTIDNFQYDAPENMNEVQQIWNNHNADNRINLYIVNELGAITYEPVFGTEQGIIDPTDGGILFSKFALALDPLWLVHGFGHYCGLLNTNLNWGEELVNGDNCETAGDQICDTPADPLDPFAPFGGLDIYFNIQCRFIWLPQDPNGEFYVPQTGNAMSNYPTSCWCGLTFDQFEKMATVIATSRLWE